MPKQGQFAKSQRPAHVKNLRQRGQRAASRVILDKDFSDFVLTRFALTSKQRLPKLTAETCQRFLQELLPRLQDDQGNLLTATTATLNYCLGRVPWQFFQQVTDNWPLLSHFCQREIPAVPLKQRLLIKEQVSQEQLDQLLGQLLSRQATAITLVNAHNQALQDMMAQKIQESIMKGTTIDWAQVRKLLQPFNQTLDTAKDVGTQAWLNELGAL